MIVSGKPGMGVKPVLSMRASGCVKTNMHLRATRHMKIKNTVRAVISVKSACEARSSVAMELAKKL